METLFFLVMVGALSYAIGSHYGYSRGETEMYQRCERAARDRRKRDTLVG